MAAYTTIDNPELFFQVQLYTGNGSANHAITLGGDENMQPDLVWIKNRDATDVHVLFDSVRGATKYIQSDSNGAEVTDTDTLDSFTSDGFQVDADVKVNTNAEKYVSWNWKAGTTSGIAGSPSITPNSYSFNATSGFSIIQYTGDGNAGATLPHGLGVAPNTIMLKPVDAVDNWEIYNSDLGATKHSVLNTDVVTGTSVYRWNNTEPTSTLFSLGSGGGVNADGTEFVVYCFVDVQGYSKFSSYEGNGNAAGTFVYTGFRPAWIMTKSADSTSHWHMFDNKREGYNVDNDALEANDTSVETTTDYIDILSNGFKIRTSTDPNVAETYFYLAFAEAPFVNSEGVPCNAR